MKIGLGMCPNGYTSADADCVNRMPQLAMVAIVSKGVKKPGFSLLCSSCASFWPQRQSGFYVIMVRV